MAAQNSNGDSQTSVNYLFSTMKVLIIAALRKCTIFERSSTLKCVNKIGNTDSQQ